MLKLVKSTFAISCLMLATSSFSDTSANSVTVHMFDTDNGKPAGTIVITETKYGLLFTPDVQGLTPGTHGFHVHENPTCDGRGMAAGGHLDPNKTDKHLGPYNDNGHLGDLPALYAEKNGEATLPVLAPRLMHIIDVKNHSLMIHEGGDNYSDNPKLGGGGNRMVCGVIK